ncbi:MAG: flagellar basal body rod protein [Magnetococcales bacterium]|nr:flagellar basal body rod protein [Magnetococcales bacterium]
MLGEGNAPINIGNTTVEVGKEGTIASSQGGMLGKLARVNINPASLQKVGNNLFVPSDGQVTPVPAGAGAIHQGRLEQSNANSVRAMTQMIDANRGFESYMKVIQQLDGIDSQANQIGRLG